MEILLDTDVKEQTGKYFLIQNSAFYFGLKASPLDRLIPVSCGASKQGWFAWSDFGKEAHDV